MRKITDLDELKEIEMGVLKHITDFCESEGIEYFLGYGTLIGAIRHKGFIPWDDDIDLIMPQEDYEKFVSGFPVYAQDKNVELVNYKTPRYYARTISKVIDTRTSLKETDYIGDDELGVFVDIWPLYGVPDNIIRQKLHFMKIKILRKLIDGKVLNLNKFNGIKYKVLRMVSSLFNMKWMLEQLDKACRKYPYEKSNNVKCYVDSYNAIMKKEWFDTKVLVDFENQKLCAPGGYDSLLRACYGDYMKLPPKEEQKPHHIADIYWKE